MAHQLDIDEVRHVAKLARLRIDDDQAVRFAAQLSKILAYAKQLAELDTRDVPPAAHPTVVEMCLRPDVLGDTLSGEAALHNAPAAHDSFFSVPKVLEQESA